MPHLKKKGIGYEFVVRLLFAIIALAAVMAIGASLFRVTKSAETSFDKFVIKVEGADAALKAGEFDSTRLDMDEGTAIYGFAQGAEAIKRFRYFKYAGDYIWNQEHELKRFNECPLEKSCLCLCKDDAIKCEKRKCKTLEKIELGSSIDEAKLINPKNLQYNEGDPIKIEGGFALFRIEAFTKTDDSGAVISFNPSGPLRQSGSGPRSKEVFIEKGQDKKIWVCLETPCIG